MDQFNELFEYTARQPLTPILDKFRENVKINADKSNAIMDLIHDLCKYCNKFKESVAISTLENQLLQILLKINDNKISVIDFDRLINSAESFASDRQIWTDVISIVNSLTQKTSSTSTHPQTSAGPQKPSNVNLMRDVAEPVGYNKKTASLTEALKAEPIGNVYKSVGNFWEAHFESLGCASLTTRFWESYRDNGQCGEDNLFSDQMDEAAMRRWFYALHYRYLGQFLEDAEELISGGPVVARSPNDPKLEGGLSPRKLDFFIENVALPKSDIHEWREVRVVGEFTCSAEQKGEKAYQLMSYVREMFYAQALRHFVHGFCLHTKHLKLWIVDRSGGYSSGEIDVINSQEKLVRALSSYMLMSDEELGLDSIVRYVGQHAYITIPEGDKPLEQIEVVPEPVARPATIYSRGNTCYQTADGDYLIKFSWGSGTKRSEIDALRLAKEIPGVINLERSGHLCNIETHRKDIDFSSGKRWDMRVWGRILTTGSESASLDRNEFYLKRGLTVAKLSPFGRPLQSCKSVRELLVGIRDATHVHRWLRDEARLLHGDVSEGNIILSPSKEGATEGMLIDLDMSLPIESSRKMDEVFAITGTMKYMALELLWNISENNFTLPQNYRHDLESFFYVLVVGCICYGREPKSEPKHLEAWFNKSVKSNYESKLSDITQNFDEMILGYFPLAFEGVKKLASNLRKILFGQTYDRFSIDESTHDLYDPIISALNETIYEIAGKNILEFT
ncbi:Serine/threonine protein kinase domain protein [Blumeria hordei DH14]|uniref:Serine/threonine protein kinase domain protein n=1 Tax=Blumeria graminis f. sp. hordei (strain DH14) TaxID=546991 RepID=N1J9Q8_BLUG1|nr:Serine/threonine protein kinase domain protein [Blumeria hordei DH14]